MFVSYPVGIGKDNKTPITVFKVSDKLEEPDWYNGERMIPYGHADNELGERWIGFEHESCKGLGIHGTNDESTVGTAVSRGCIRLRNVDVIQLYRWVPPGTVVEVRA